jgi:anti-sigma regulatory factor (Ser/Thr protein kinase)
MTGRADAVRRSFAPVHDPEPSSSVDPASTMSNPGERVNSWPLSSYLELGAMPSAVPSARLHARLILSEWGLGELTDDIELIISELVTNAMQASQELGGHHWYGEWKAGSSPIRLWLRADHTTVLVQVWDGSDRLPHKKLAEPKEENGRGLLIVEALCQRYGTYALGGCSGKVVWAEVGS